jgi:hypothetical protein
MLTQQKNPQTVCQSTNEDYVYPLNKYNSPTFLHEYDDVFPNPNTLYLNTEGLNVKAIGMAAANIAMSTTPRQFDRRRNLIDDIV